ncbi:MAG: hypothetical protein QNL01_03675 [Akkermansiaceae bacterium]
MEEPFLCLRISKKGAKRLQMALARPGLTPSDEIAEVHIGGEILPADVLIDVSNACSVVSAVLQFTLNSAASRCTPAIVPTQRPRNNSPRRCAVSCSVAVRRCQSAMDKPTRN